MVHMELFYHFLASPYGFVGPEKSALRLAKEIAVQHAVTTPFLMHQLLALSARQRSSVDPDRAPFFRHLATQLQTHAISLFGRVDLNAELTTAERVPIFLFSSLLGFQDLCDTLSLRPLASFEAFMARYLSYVRLHRGVHKVIQGFWPVLRDSELKAVLDAGEEMYKASGIGHECDDICARIGAADTLSDADKEACRSAIRHLQVVFDSKPDATPRANVLLAWAPMFPDGFLQLLEAGRKEALCVLGYYFVLLHFCRDVWFVYDSGESLLGLLVDYLGPEWADWMERPKELLRLGPGS